MVLLDFFQWHNPSGRTMALGLTQHLIEMSTRNISSGLTNMPPSCADCLKIWEPRLPRTLRDCQDLQWDYFTFTFLPLENESKFPFETSGPIYPATQHNIPEDTRAAVRNWKLTARCTFDLYKLIRFDKTMQWVRLEIVALSCYPVYCLLVSVV
jgi:hypothetical protein